MGWNHEARLLHEKIRRMERRLAEQDKGPTYVTYVIRDPVTHDPFYVGQTSNIVKRFRSHMRRGGTCTKGRSGLYPRIYRLLADGKVPFFEILERVGTLEESLKSETRWIHAFRREGHRLVNRWGEHTAKAAAKSGSRRKGDEVFVPAKRLWRFTIEQAYVHGIGLKIDCRRCRLNVPLDLIEVADRCGEQTCLAQIRKVVSCPQCGNRKCLRIVRPKPGMRQSRNTTSEPTRDLAVEDDMPPSSSGE